MKWVIDSIALLSHFHKVLALSKFTLLKYEIEVNPIAPIPWATSTAQFQFAQCWWPRESMLWDSSMLSEFHTSLSKVLILWNYVKVKQIYLFASKAKIIYCFTFTHSKYGSVALLWHNAKVLALLKVKCEIHYSSVFN